MLKNIVRWIQNIEIVVVVALVVLCLGGLPFGIRTYVVLSGSMEPNIHVGALAYVQTRVDCSELRTGDVITFNVGEDTVVTHRIVRHDAGQELFVTKGDANSANDASPVPYDEVVGKTLLSVSGLGYLLVYVGENKWALLVALLVANILLWKIAEWGDGNDDGPEGATSEDAASERPTR